MIKKWSVENYDIVKYILKKISIIIVSKIFIRFNLIS